ncbi:MAG: SUMF1/EgtB/PvdO family nonheme iron enzyme [Chitinophagaceae bacterium]|nr:SUMF1/EgtB/PvdO family nonheme iron enzyme [Chitinophagaceae bacterium]
MMKRLLLFPALFFGMSVFGQGNINVQMIYVKGGYFFRGADEPKYSGEEFANEKPVHRVNVSSFAISKYEITQGQWRTLMGILPASYIGTDYINKECDDCPVVKVNYDEVQEFIRRLNEKYPGKNYRLPTELEWEYAARGGKYSGNYRYAGSNKLSTVGWYGKPKGATHPVGEKEPNELGIYDMSGNVMEWCSDWYDAEYYKTTLDAVDPKGPAKGDKKVARGGSYFDDDVVCRTVYRSRFAPKTRQWNLGFRLATDN